MQERKGLRGPWSRPENRVRKRGAAPLGGEERGRPRLRKKIIIYLEEGEGKDGRPGKSKKNARPGGA